MVAAAPLPFVEAARGVGGSSYPILRLLTQSADGLHLRSDYARSRLDQVLDAEDAAELLDLLDELSADDSFWQAESDPAKKPPAGLEQARAELEATKVDLSVLVPVLGEAAVARCQTGLDALHAFARKALGWAEWLQLFAAAGVIPAASQARTPGPDAKATKVSDLFYDPKIPLGARRAVARGVRAVLAWCAIVRAHERDRPLPRWLALELADTFASAAEQLLGSASLEGAIAMVVAFQRGVAEAEAARAETDRWQREAKAHGGGLYFPLDPAANDPAR